MSPFRSFAVQSSGNVALTFGLALTALVPAFALGLTYADAARVRDKMQKSVDAGALAGASLPMSSTSDQRIARARNVYFSNLKEHFKDDPKYLVELAAIQPSYSAQGYVVSGDVTGKVPNQFRSFIGSGETSVGVRAKATKRESNPVCLLGLDQTEAQTLDLNGRAVLNATNCAAQTNSASGQGMKMVGSASARASHFGVTGGVSGDNFVPKPFEGTPQMADPLANSVAPSPGACNGAPKMIHGGNETLSPGTYCGGIDIKNGAQVTLLPGVYFMKDGALKIDSGAVVSGSEVVIAFAGKQATLWMTGGAALKLTSPASGPYVGIQFYQIESEESRNLWFQVGGGSKLEYEGIAYFPTQHMWIFGGSVVNAVSASYAMIAKKLWFQDNTVTTVTQANPRNLPVKAASGFRYGATLIN